MKHLCAALAALAIATANAGNTQAQQLTSGTSPTTFTIGPRISSYSTDVELGINSHETGRQTAFGMVGGLRSGAFVLDFNFDHDPEDGLDFIDIFGAEEYTRDRFEGTVGWSVLPVLDIQGGLRMDQISLGAFGGRFFDAGDLDIQALTFGATVHTPDHRPVRLYGTGRYYLGTGEFGNSPGREDEYDATGWRIEGGVMIRIGQSNWHVVPGAELERLDLDEGGFSLDTNRLFVNVVWSSGGR